MRHLTLPPRSNWWLPATALLAVLGGEWLRTLAPILVVAVVLAALAVILLVPWRRGGPSLLTVAWLAGTIALSISATAHRHSLLAKGVPAETRRQADRAIAETRRRLDRLQQELARVARKAETLPLESREAAFNAAEDLVAEADPAMALGVLGAAGQPVVWAGTHRLPLAAGTQTHAFRHTSFYSVLELRRQRADGGMVVVSALIWADSILANTPPSLIGEIRNDLDVDVLLEKMGPGVAGVPWPADAPVLSIVVPQQDPAGGVARLRRRSGPVVAGLLLGLIGAAVVGTTVPAARFMMLALVPWLVLRAPLDRALGLEAYLSPATFFSPLLGPLSSSTGTLAVTGGLLLVLAVAAWHRRPPRTAGSLLLAVVLLVAAPYLLREFGRGITPPAAGVPAWLWLTWHFTLMVTAAAMLAAAAALLRGREPARRSWPTLLGALLGIAAAGVGVLAYTGRPAWPTWYTALWLPGILLAARPASRRVTILAVGCIAGAGATLMTWGAAITGRTDVAVRDINSLGSTRDPVVEPLLIGFATRLGEDPPTEPAALFRAWRRSPLWRDGLPVRLTVWEAGRPGVDVVLNRLSVDDSVLAALAARVTDSSGPLLTAVSVSPGVHYVVAVRADSARTLTVTVGPRSQLVPAAPLGRTLEVAPQRTPLYRLAMAGLPPGQEAPRRTGWRREGWALRTTRPVVVDGHPLEVNALIALGRPGSLFVRGGLLLLLDVALVWVLWVVAERISGIPWRPPDFRRVVASYQGRLAIALSVFFVTPAAVLAGVSIRQLTSEAGRSRDLVLQRVLRDAMPPGDLATLAGDRLLASRAGQVDAHLAVYAADGRLQEVSDPLLSEVGVFTAQLEASVYHAIHLDGDLAAAPRGSEGRLRTGYALLPLQGAGDSPVLATVGIASDPALRERQLDVVFTLILITLLGIVAAILSARVAARALSRPVADLREAALAFGMGLEVPGPRRRPPTEIAPVFDAFGRMAADVRAGQAALERARQRTEQVLATVSTGVAAVDQDGRVILANPQAENTPGLRLQRGELLESGLSESWAPLAAEAARIRMAGGEGGVELEVAGRRFAVRLASLASEPGGMVIAVTDVTEATQAARVLAWAELANQVAHAIKNPLTPLRLGVQHLERVREKHPDRLGDALAGTAARILDEIDRLDAIARAFARFAAPAEPVPLEAVDMRVVFEEVTGLYRMAPDLLVRTEIGGAARVLARQDELVEVLLNLCDNARNAGAREVAMRLDGEELEIRDDGRGIAPEHLARIFEPRFSTTSSGSGLGLAIVRRLVEGWGGEVGVESVAGRGAVFRIRFQPPR